MNLYMSILLLVCTLSAQNALAQGDKYVLDTVSKARFFLKFADEDVMATRHVRDKECSVEISRHAADYITNQFNKTRSVILSRKTEDDLAVNELYDNAVARVSECTEE